MALSTQTAVKPREIVVDLANSSDLLSQSKVQQWVELATEESIGDVFVNFVTTEESRQLNHNFRSIDEPTNVLSFPADHEHVLGDIAICADVARKQADAQNKHLDAHLAHLVIHGVLHLRGFDHVDSQDASVMENKEIALLKMIGVANPYE